VEDQSVNKSSLPIPTGNLKVSRSEQIFAHSQIPIDLSLPIGITGELVRLMNPCEFSLGITGELVRLMNPCEFSLN